MLLELLISLNILLVISLVILPQYMLVKNERLNIALQDTAISILKTELQEFIHDDQPTENRMITVGNTDYLIRWTYMEDIKKWKVCISWLDTFDRRVERCGYGQR
jgi:type II secretory pathway pseudopilin PulG